MRIILLLLVLITNNNLANADEFFRMDYSDHWIIYDKQNGNFVPVLGEISNNRTIHFFLDLVANAGKEFEICSNAEISILINGSIVQNKKLHGCLLWEMDSLHQSYRKDSIQLTIYKVDREAELSTSILYPALGFVPEENPIKARVTSIQSNYILFALIIIGIAALMIREFNYRFFEEFSSVSKIFAIRVRSSQIYLSKPLSKEIFLVIVLQSISVSFLLISVSQFSPDIEVFFIESSTTFWNLIGQWFLVSIGLVGIFYLQFIVLYLTNLFFKNHRILHIQFYDNLRIVHFYLIALFVIIILFYALSTSIFLWFISQLWIITIGLFIVKGLVIYLKMLNETSHRKLHIFSYFCATEILPVALVVKIVLS